jgi:hypothetical protein
MMDIDDDDLSVFAVWSFPKQTLTVRCSMTSILWTWALLPWAVWAMLPWKKKKSGCCGR